MSMLIFVLASSLLVSCCDAYVAGQVWARSRGRARPVVVATISLSAMAITQFWVVIGILSAFATGRIGLDGLFALMSRLDLLVILPALGAAAAVIGIISVIHGTASRGQPITSLDGQSAQAANGRPGFLSLPGGVRQMFAFFSGASASRISTLIAFALSALLFVAMSTSMVFFIFGRHDGCDAAHA